MAESAHRLLQNCQRVTYVAVHLREDGCHFLTSKPALALAVLLGVLVERGLRGGKRYSRIPVMMGRYAFTALSLANLWGDVRKTTLGNRHSAATDRVG